MADATDVLLTALAAAFCCSRAAVLTALAANNFWRFSPMRRRVAWDGE
jgi:hypothetical protein